MKLFPRILSCLLLTLVISSYFSSPLKACDRSLYVLDSTTFDGTTYTVYTTFCIGGGIIGSTQGADNFTGLFAFGIYGSETMQMNSWGPTSFTSDTTNCQANGVTFSSVPNIPSDTGIVYFPNSCFYACISSTAFCGNPHSDCNQLIITFNELPDSIRLYGPEGTGNPVAGCYPNPTMIIDFTILPVIWSSFDAHKQDEHVDISWATTHEYNNSHYRVMRSGSEGEWTEIGMVGAVGYSESAQSYSFVDENPQQGVNQYKVIQVDNDGRSSETETVSLNFELENQLEWRQIGPVPTHDVLNVSFITNSPQAMSLSLFNVKGEIVYDQSVSAEYGLNKKSIDLGSLSSGVYYLSLTGSQGTLRKKIVKI